MILKLDSRWPVVWRSPTSLQVGVDPPKAVFDTVSAAQEHMLAALVRGISPSGFELLHEDHPEQRDRLLDAVTPALEASTRSSEPALVCVSGGGAVAPLIAEMLGRSGVRVVLASSHQNLDGIRPTLAVVAGIWVIPPALQGHWLRRDVPHLAIVTSDCAIEIGPLVSPGDGPCLRCLELHRLDADAAWPAVATQLNGRSGGATSPTVVAEAGALATRMLLARLKGEESAARSVRIDEASGERTETLWSTHPRCGCSGIGELPA